MRQLHSDLQSLHTKWTSLLNLVSIWTLLLFEDPHAATASNASHDNPHTPSNAFLRITTIVVEPYLMIDNSDASGHSQPKKVGNARYYGYLPDLLREMSTMMNFRYELYTVPDGSYGYRISAGKWSGLIGELTKGVADLAAGPILITDNRKEAVDFTIPFLNSQATLLIRRSPTGSEQKIKDIGDLINQSEIKYGTLRKGIIPRSFKRTNDTLLKIMWRQMQKFGSGVFTSTNEEGIERVRRDKFAFVLPDTIGEYMALRQPCDFLTVGPFLMKKGFGLALPKNSNRLEQFNRAIKDLRKSGYLDRLKYKWWTGRSECNGIRSSKMYSANSAAQPVFAMVTSKMRTRIEIMTFFSLVFNCLIR